MTPHQGVVAKKIKFLNICNNDDLQLNKNHNYYYQIRGRLRVANKLSWYLIIWTSIGNEIMNNNIIF